jgi:hypothetical protein
VENLASYVDNKGKTWIELIVRANVLERITQIASTADCALTCAGYLVYLFENDEKKGRTEGF